MRLVRLYLSITLAYFLFGKDIDGGLVLYPNNSYRVIGENVVATCTASGGNASDIHFELKHVKIPAENVFKVNDSTAKVIFDPIPYITEEYLPGQFVCYERGVENGVVYLHFATLPHPAENLTVTTHEAGVKVILKVIFGRQCDYPVPTRTNVSVILAKRVEWLACRKGSDLTCDSVMAQPDVKLQSQGCDTMTVTCCRNIADGNTSAPDENISIEVTSYYNSTFKLNTTTTRKSFQIKDIAIPGRVENLRADVVTSTSVKLLWRCPLRYQSMTYILSHNCSWDGSQVSLPVKDVETHVINNLHPNLRCDVTIKCQFTSYSRWSPTAVVTITTKQSVPSALPQVTPGGFEINQNTSGLKRKVTLFWGKIPEEHQNGEIVKYNVTVCGLSTNPCQHLQGKDFHRRVTLEKSQAYSLFVEGKTTEGRNISLEPKAVIIASTSEMPPPPKDVTAVATGGTRNGKYVNVSIRWKDNRNRNCTVHIRRDEKDPLLWVTSVTSPYTIYNMPQGQKVGVSCEDGPRSSGIVWTDCVWLTKSVPPAPGVEAFDVRTTSAKVKVTKPMSCKPYNGHVDRYRLHVCSVQQAFKNCSEVVISATYAVTSSFMTLDVPNLQQGTTYNVTVSSVTRDGVQSEHSATVTLTTNQLHIWIITISTLLGVIAIVLFIIGLNFTLRVTKRHIESETARVRKFVLPEVTSEIPPNPEQSDSEEELREVAWSQTEDFYPGYDKPSSHPGSYPSLVSHQSPTLGHAPCVYTTPATPPSFLLRSATSHPKTDQSHSSDTESSDGENSAGYTTTGVLVSDIRPEVIPAYDLDLCTERTPFMEDYGEDGASSTSGYGSHAVMTSDTVPCKSVPKSLANKATASTHAHPEGGREDEAEITDEGHSDLDSDTSGYAAADFSMSPDVLRGSSDHDPEVIPRDWESGHRASAGGSSSCSSCSIEYAAAVMVTKSDSHVNSHVPMTTRTLSCRHLPPEMCSSVPEDLPSSTCSENSSDDYVCTEFYSSTTRTDSCTPTTKRSNDTDHRPGSAGYNNSCLWRKRATDPTKSPSEFPPFLDSPFSKHVMAHTEREDVMSDSSSVGQSSDDGYHATCYKLQ